MRRALSLLLGFSLLAAARAHPLAAQGAEPPPAMLLPGDVVKITVWRNPELTGEFPIDPDSTLRHPLYRGIKIGGRTVTDAVQQVRSVLLRYETEPQFTVEPRFRVSVTGQVRSPNMYTFPPEVTLAQAVTLAGGLTELGSVKARLLRGGGRATVRLDRPTDGLAAQPVRSGDVILVERRRTGVFSGVLIPAVSLVGALASVLFLIRR